MIINHNLSAMNAHRQLGANQAAGAKAQEKLSSGLRINRAGDDAAGLAISEKMRAQVRGLDQASRNAQDGISLIQTAEGALNETHSILQRMRELAVQASNDTNQNDVDRAAIQEELTALTEEIDRIADTTAFNDRKLIDGTLSGDTNAIKFHIGANSGQSISVSINSMKSEALGLSGVSLATQSGAEAAISTINDAINSVSTQRSALGAVQNRLEHTISNLDNSAENLQAAESRIRDVDMAKEVMEFTKNNILSQASQAMLAQANQAPQSVLQLLG
ncbi:flagellin N-terminal helical domain-containing protein [Alkalicoccobacillus murimartini]|uniref:Flagellin n=1 Tax=Alkalicoccobacillus murimartini TaxID=171685 RepID=A0ABT9YH57_9BACI|nr:flagellin [Alkalicoccobacillus murimartini]MDQ0206938.1 flagellin [Alkalicoccobacillus murimartini]